MLVSLTEAVIARGQALEILEELVAGLGELLLGVGPVLVEVADLGRRGCPCTVDDVVELGLLRVVEVAGHRVEEQDCRKMRGQPGAGVAVHDVKPTVHRGRRIHQPEQARSPSPHPPAGPRSVAGDEDLPRPGPGPR